MNPDFSLYTRSLPLLFCLFLLGCASISIKSSSLGESDPQKLPDCIYVEKFQAPPSYFHVSRKGKELLALVEEEQKHLAEDLVKRLNKHIAPAVLLADGSAPPHGNYWLVRGSFEMVNGGNRLLRASIGCGLGKTAMETTAQLFDLSHNDPELLLTMTTTGGSGFLPGAAAAFAPIAPLTLSTTLVNAGGSSAGGLGSGISSDRWRTAREIVAMISEYSVQHGLILKSRALHPKRLGEIPPLF